MTANEIARHQIDDAGFQISKAFEGLTEEQIDAKPLASMMSAREQAEHLCECYHAAAKSAAGEQHEWGTYAVEDKSWGNVSSLMTSLRARAATDMLALGDDKLAEALGYLAAHDYYHVGQLCSLRLALDPEWNAESIYEL